MTYYSSPKSRQHGITLLESLIALIISALGVLAIVGIQLKTLVDTQTTVHRSQAIRLIEDLSERLRSHPNALQVINSYESSFADLPSPSGCTNNSMCASSALITRDLGVWKENVRNNLPLGEAEIFIAPGDTKHQLGVMVAWRENERDDADSNYKIGIDAVQGGGGSGDDVSCPAGKTCHLQYITVPSRCILKDEGDGNIFKPYCPGG